MVVMFNAYKLDFLQRNSYINNICITIYTLISNFVSNFFFNLELLTKSIAKTQRQLDYSLAASKDFSQLLYSI